MGTSAQDLMLAMADGGVNRDCVGFNRLCSRTLTLYLAAFSVPRKKKKLCKYVSLYLVLNL